MHIARSGVSLNDLTDFLGGSGDHTGINTLHVGLVDSSGGGSSVDGLDVTLLGLGLDYLTDSAGSLVDLAGGHMSSGSSASSHRNRGSVDRVEVALESLTLVNLGHLLGGATDNTSGDSLGVRVRSSGSNSAMSLLQIAGNDFSVNDLTNHLGGLT